MKIKKIGSLCSKSKLYCLYDTVGAETGEVSQWVGDGFAMYPISGLPYLNEGGLFTLFDVSEKQRANLHFRHSAAPDMVCLEDHLPGEMRIDHKHLSVVYGGEVLRPLQTRNGVVFIESKHLSPLEDVLEVMELYERVTTSGATYIAAKAGFVLSAIIFPRDVISDGFVSQLETLTAQCRRVLQRKETARTAHATGAGAEMEGEEE